MHDSRAGGFGIIGVVLLLLVKYASLSSIPQPSLMMALVLMPVLSRWAMVYAIFAYPIAQPSSLGRVFKEGTSWVRLTMATLTALAVAVALAQLVGLAIMFLIWVMTVAIATYLRRKFSGLTGDTYGAINELAELGVLIFVALLAYSGLI
jgi:adenosylcobinamide-GDP ribazoletransferase